MNFWSWLKKFFRRLTGWCRRKRQARQKTQCTAISLLLDKPNFDVCSVCTNQFCICKIKEDDTEDKSETEAE